MSPISFPEIKLSSGGKVPVMALGTATIPPVASEITIQAVLEAIRLGVRHFDTAAAYLSEEPLGEAIAEALRLGLISSRAELFITSKIWCSDNHADRVLPALQKSLQMTSRMQSNASPFHVGESFHASLTDQVTYHKFSPAKHKEVYTVKYEER